MKDCLILGNTNAVTYKDFFPLLKDNKVRLGYATINGGMDMYAGPNFDPGKKKVKYDENGNMIVNIEGVVWYTTLATPGKRKLVLSKTYDPERYPTYDHYSAINVDKVKDIPYDYDGVMGVPVSILSYSLENVEIVDARDYTDKYKDKATQLIKDDAGKINGKPTYARVLIQKKNYKG